MPRARVARFTLEGNTMKHETYLKIDLVMTYVGYAVVAIIYCGGIGFLIAGIVS